MRQQIADIAVIGGGASALAFAAMCRGRDIVVFERGARVGKKLLSTGNGKCNLTGTGVTAEGYNVPDLVRPFLEKFPPQKTVEFFASLGLLTREMNGRVYPYSECASSVLDVLLRALSRNGVRVRTRCEVRAVKREKDGFVLDVALLGEKGEDIGSERVRAGTVVLAAGSSAAQGRDSTALFEASGHTVRAFSPSLVPLKTDRESVKGLNGVRVKCAATLCGVREEGEILFRDYGISGIAAMDLSALYARGIAHDGDTVSLDLTPDIPEEDVRQFIFAQTGAGSVDALKGMFHTRVAERIAERAGQAPSDKADAGALARVIKNYTLTLKGTCDASQAQVMSGGLDLAEFDGGLCSVMVPGAYAVGEALDVDGLCGGYNLQWAWASAYAAAQALSRG